MSSSFHEIRFPVQYDWGTEASPEFNTNVVELPSGAESRNSFWTTGRRTWKMDSTGLSSTQKKVAEAFFRARLGNVFGFRLYDTELNSVVDEPLPLTDNTHAQLQFVYADAINPQTQIVRKPVLAANIQPSNVVQYYAPDITLKRNTGSGFVAFASGGNWTIDRNTGIITFGASQAGNTFEWSGGFDWPVRFSESKTMWSRQFIEDFEWTGIMLQELLNEV